MIIALANQKGGTGKTTTASAIFAAYPNSLGIDLDAQANFTLLSGANEDYEFGSYHVLTKTCGIKDAIQQIGDKGFVAGSPELSALSKISPLTLRDALTEVKDKYNHVVIDTPPVFNDATMNALSAADVLVIPLMADLLSIKGLSQIIKNVEAVQEVCNPNLKIGGLLLTHFEDRSKLFSDLRGVIETYAAGIGVRVFKTAIRQSLTIMRSQAAPKDIFSFDPQAKMRATQDYLAFVKELNEVLQ